MRSVFSSVLCSLFFIIFSILGYSQNICNVAVEPVCSNETFNAEAPDLDVNGSVRICNNASYPMDNVAFYYVKIQEAGTFTFLIHKDPQDDYDFAVWQNPDCQNLGIADRASFLQDDLFNIPTTGLALNEQGTCENAGGGIGNIYTPGVVRHLDVQEGDEIYIMVYRPIDPITGETAGDFSVSFGGGAELDCTIMGESYGKCDMDENQQETFDMSEFLPDLNNEFPGSNFEFYYSNTDAQNGTGTQVIFPHTVNFIDNPNEIFVRVKDSDGVFIKAVQINLFVNKLPQITSPVSLTVCDIGGDGTEEFNLTLAEPDLVTDPSLFTFKYYEDEADANAGASNFINPATAYNSEPDEIYVRVESGPLDGNELGCASIGKINLLLTAEIPTEFDLEEIYCLNEIPTLNTISDNGIEGTWSPSTIQINNYEVQTYIFTPNADECATPFEIDIQVKPVAVLDTNLEIKLCDDNFDGIFEYDLTLIDDQLIGSTTGLTFSYYASITDYNNNNPIPASQWSNYPLSLPTSIIVTAENNDGCKSDDVQVDFVEGQGIALLGSPYEVPFCEVETVDLTLFQIGFLTNESDVAYSYYPSNSDAINQTAEITDITNHTPSDIGAEIFVRIEKNDGTLCTEIVKIDFIAGQLVPVLPGPYEVPFCEGETVDLTFFQGGFLTNEPDVTYSYYPSNSDAENQTAEITDINNFPSPAVGQNIYVRIEKNDGTLCTEIVKIDFVAGQEVMHNPGPYTPINYCAGTEINITDYISEIPNESDIIFTYYETQSDAENATNPIPDETLYTPEGNGYIYIRLEKTGRCAVVVVLPYEVLSSPEILNVPSQLELCVGETIILTAESDDLDATYLWTWGNGQSVSGPEIQITEIGTYLLTVTGSNTCISTRELIVETGGAPVIASVESGSNYLIVNAQAGRGGMLEYSLNQVLWQSSPRFDNLIKGQTYTVYVRENGCLIDSYTIAILDIPNFVSPNGDGINDLWTIKGIEVTPAATIKIFDRYGKVFVDTNFDGNYVWDGKYGGRSVPSGSYWYILEVPTDGIIAAQKFVGHISIRK